jgi:Transglutaminase-like enzymes, putative cysteine proteases
MNTRKWSLVPIIIVIIIVCISTIALVLNHYDLNPLIKDSGKSKEQYVPLGILPARTENSEEIVVLDMSRIEFAEELLIDKNREVVVKLDYSMLDKGLVYVSSDNIDPGKLRLSFYTDTSDVQSCSRIFKEGYYPLINGSGTYYLQIFVESVTETFSGVAITYFFAEFDEIELYKYSNFAATYHEDSPLAHKAYEITKGLGSDHEKAEEIARVLRTRFVYDIDYSVLAEEVGDCDLFYEREGGVCYHFSALFSAMMRSIGIPTREVRGSLEFDESLYHSWNEYYSDGEWHLVDVMNYNFQEQLKHVKDKNSER